jgi:Icc-related predicted phosphoesterase
MKPKFLGEHEGPLRIAAISDYRAQEMSLLVDAISRLRPTPDVILYGGDDIERFHGLIQGNLFEVLAAKSKFGLCAVAGNDEPLPMRKLIRGNRVFNVHQTPVILGNYAIIGSEGAPYRRDLPGVGYTLYTESQIREQLARQKKAVDSKTVIVLSHTPPAGLLDVAQRFSADRKPRSIGSNALRKFISKHKNAAVVVCGHVHRCGGQQERFKHSVIVNAANHDDDKSIARIALITVQPDGSSTVAWQHIRPVSVIPGVGLASVEDLAGVGIRTIEELAVAQPELLKGVLRSGCPPYLLIARAQAIVEERPVLLRPMQLPGGQEVFLDIETDLRQTYTWLIGVSAGDSDQYEGFFAKSPFEERQILEQFLAFVSRYPTATLVTCSGSRFEERVMRKRLTIHGLPTSICERIIDLHATISPAVALPTASFRVKDIGEYFGYQFRHPDLDGFTVAELYESSYCLSQRQRAKRILEQKLREYNQDDVLCLPYILRKLRSLLTPIPS